MVNVLSFEFTGFAAGMFYSIKALFLSLLRCGCLHNGHFGLFSPHPAALPMAALYCGDFCSIFSRPWNAVTQNTKKNEKT